MAMAIQKEKDKIAAEKAIALALATDQSAR